MENVNKYYVPELEEFHVGFEYEELVVCYTYSVKLLEPIKDGEAQLQVISEPVPEESWEKRIYSLDDFILSNYEEVHIEIPQVRVKYLDAQDIKDLGFESVWSEFDTVTFSKDNITLTWWSNSNYIRINYTTTKYQLFEGQIKNKAELSKLLKQIGWKERI